MFYKHEEWEEQTRTLMNFIRSNSKPHIFYLPKSHTDASLKKHEHSNAALEGQFEVYNSLSFQAL